VEYTRQLDTDIPGDIHNACSYSCHLQSCPLYYTALLKAKRGQHPTARTFDYLLEIMYI
jgi:hypothetical protein